MTRALVWSELKLVLREPLTLVCALGFPLVLLYLLLTVFGNQPDPDFGGTGATDYYVPAYAVMVVAAGALLSLPVHVAAYRERGVLRRLAASGVAPWTVVAAQIAVTVALVTVGAALMVLLGFVSFDLSTPASWPGVVAAFALAAVALTALGIALAALVPTARAAQGLGLLLFFGAFFIAGGGPPDPVLPDTVTTVARAVPMTYGVDLVQGTWSGAGWDLTAVGVLAGVLAAGIAVAVARLRTAV